MVRTYRDTNYYGNNTNQQDDTHDDPCNSTSAKAAIITIVCTTFATASTPLGRSIGA